MLEIHNNQLIKHLIIILAGTVKVEAWCCRDRQSIRSCQLVFPPSRHLDHLGQTQQLLKLKSDDFFCSMTQCQMRQIFDTTLAEL